MNFKSFSLEVKKLVYSVEDWDDQDLQDLYTDFKESLPGKVPTTKDSQEWIKNEFFEYTPKEHTQWLREKFPKVTKYNYERYPS